MSCTRTGHSASGKSQTREAWISNLILAEASSSKLKIIVSLKITNLGIILKSFSNEVNVRKFYHFPFQTQKSQPVNPEFRSNHETFQP